MEKMELKDKEDKTKIIEEEKKEFLALLWEAGENRFYVSGLTKDGVLHVLEKTFEDLIGRPLEELEEMEEELDLIEKAYVDRDFELFRKAKRLAESEAAKLKQEAEELKQKEEKLRQRIADSKGLEIRNDLKTMMPEFIAEEGLDVKDNLEVKDLLKSLLYELAKEKYGGLIAVEEEE